MLDRQKCPVWLVDAREHMFLDVNDAACDLFGRSRDELLNSTFTDVLDFTERERYVKHIPEALESWGDGGDWHCTTSAGERFSVKLRFHVMTFGDRIAFFCFPIEINGEPILPVSEHGYLNPSRPKANRAANGR